MSVKSCVYAYRYVCTVFIKSLHSTAFAVIPTAFSNTARHTTCVLLCSCTGLLLYIFTTQQRQLCYYYFNNISDLVDFRLRFCLLSVIDTPSVLVGLFCLTVYSRLVVLSKYDSTMRPTNPVRPGKYARNCCSGCAGSSWGT